MRQKAVYFLVFLVALFFLSVEVAAKTELEEKLVKIEADLEQMKSEFALVEKKLAETKESLRKSLEKIRGEEKVIDYKSSIPLWLIIVIMCTLGGMCIILDIVTKRKPPNKRAKN